MRLDSLGYPLHQHHSAPAPPAGLPFPPPLPPFHHPCVPPTQMFFPPPPFGAPPMHPPLPQPTPATPFGYPPYPYLLPPPQAAAPFAPAQRGAEGKKQKPAAPTPVETPRKPSKGYTGVASEEDVMRNVYITGLGPEVTDEVLLDAFGAHGKVLSFKLMIDLDTGINRGYAFVMFAQAHDAHRACAEMDGTPLCGRRVSVRMADKNLPTSALPGLPTKKMFVRNVPRDVTEEALRAALPAGTRVIEIAINPDGNSGFDFNMAHVVCETVEMAQRAAARLNGAKPFPSSTRPLLSKVVDTLARQRKAAHVASVTRGGEKLKKRLGPKRNLDTAALLENDAMHSMISSIFELPLSSSSSSAGSVDF